MSAPFRFPKFFVTNPSPCPYLPGKVERKVFTELNGRNRANSTRRWDGSASAAPNRLPAELYDCSACISVRVVSDEFTPNATQRAAAPPRRP